MTECRCWHDLAATQSVATTRWHIGTTLLAAVQAADTVLSQSSVNDAFDRQRVKTTPRRAGTLSRKERGSRLIQAAKQGAVGEMQALLAKGADVGARGSEGMAALHWAAVEGRVEAVRCLLEGGAEVDARSNDQNTPLHTATSAPATPGTRRQPHSDRGRTPAAAAPPTAARHTPPPDEAAVSRLRTLSRKERGSRLIQAAKQGAVGEMQALLATGADVGARDSEGMAALHWAAVEGRVEAVRCLLEGGAEVDARSNDQNTPLHTATRYGHAAVVRLLVAASADLNARNEDGQTPLHRAAAYGHPEVVAVLLEAGADKGARDDSGATPRHIARQKNNQQLVEMLTRNVL
ncbi:protein VAPYRIN-like [Schistocerca piceifrons]|uniref:protein VAPYRIN-like n=1 Tax=Schistocerca piceifrons TaxID=274613 RepID=UPI001F5FC4A5|nr:protein VAPYRIN-like [Schistocerca piceifrons]